MRSKYYSLKKRIIALRNKGKTYGEIQKILDIAVPKSTLSYWCRDIALSKQQQKRIQQSIYKNIHRGRAIALVVNKIKREKYLESIESRVKHLKKIIKDKNTAKIALAMLYLGEGSKTQRGSLIFANSDPKVVGLFVCLLRYCYNIDESKFRCTLQCRADQNIEQLEKFWSRTINIPVSQFYKARVDPRTIGKPSRKVDYKGVCRIDYFSADIYIELLKTIEVVADKILGP